jgi:hypothetical protein
VEREEDSVMGNPFRPRSREERWQACARAAGVKLEQWYVPKRSLIDKFTKVIPEIIRVLKSADLEELESYLGL